ncbi:hypothetical protein UlMin_038844 [Ulmus minor]
MSTASAEQFVEAYGMAARDSSGILSPFHFTWRANGDNDITIKILYCGICHTDLHLAKDEIGMTIYPLVPGHEVVGEVTKVGRNVNKFKVGDKAGVGCMVGSCRACESCKQDEENYCPEVVWIFNGQFPDGTRSYGGYANKIGAKGTMDGIMDTVSAPHSFSPLTDLLKTNGKLILVGAPVPNPELPVFQLLMGRRLIGGSATGGIKETQEMIDFAAKHNISADIEVIPMDYVNTAFERLAKNDVKSTALSLM